MFWSLILGCQVVGIFITKTESQKVITIPLSISLLAI